MTRLGCQWIGSPSRRCHPLLPRGSGPGNAQVSADLHDKQVIDLAVARHRAAAIEFWLMPPRVVAAFSEQLTAVQVEMAE
jgi:hypothetical protein